MDASDIFWKLLSLFFIGLAYFSAITFVAGLLWKVIVYLRTPMPLPHALTPAPRTEGRAILRVLGEVTLFRSLFQADKWLWGGAWIFHAALAAILFRHLRYFTYPVPGIVLYMETVALFFGILFGAAILFLLWRRLGLPRTLYISNLPDYFALALLALIAGTGIMVSYWLHVYLVDVKGFLLGLMTFHPVEVPRHPLFLLHLFLVLILMLYFPFSKLLHAGGIFFSPSRHQPYQVQERGKRYENPLDR
ncbi:MAG: nitrate reductase [Chloroflexi bacterium]|nr:MAG: nitrate reductase [Chloroflexota bacterium]